MVALVTATGRRWRGPRAAGVVGVVDQAAADEVDGEHAAGVRIDVGVRSRVVAWTFCPAKRGETISQLGPSSEERSTSGRKLFRRTAAV